MVQVLSTTLYRQMEPVALLTKAIWISTPLVLGIVVCVARRLILYKKQRKGPSDRIVHRSQRKIVSYMGLDERGKREETRQSDVSA